MEITKIYPPCWFAKIGIFIECYKFCGDNLLYFPKKCGEQQ